MRGLQVIREGMRTAPIAVALLAVLLVLTAAGCGGDDDTDAGPATEPAPPPAQTEPGTTETETDGGIDPLDGATSDPVTGQAETDEIALVERVDIGRHEGFDRVVLQFRQGVPGYRIAYTEEPVTEDGSGARVEVDGDAVVLVRLEPSSTFDIEQGEPAYDGPRRLAGADRGTSVVREVVRAGDFEAVLTWAIGLSDRVDYRVTTLQSPARLVIDFRNH
jgi:hypothetical protein